MAVLAISSAVQLSRFAIGPYDAILLGDVVSPGAIRYAFVLEVLEHGTRRRCYAVASELNAMARTTGGGSHFLCVYDGGRHENLGASNEWAHRDVFVRRAVELARARLGVVDAVAPAPATNALTAIAGVPALLEAPPTDERAKLAVWRALDEIIAALAQNGTALVPDEILSPIIAFIGERRGVDYTRMRAVMILDRAGGSDARVVDALLGALGDPDPPVLVAAVRALSSRPRAAARVVPALLAALPERLGTRGAVPAIVGALRALAPSSAPLALPLLTSALRDTSWSIRAEAAEALGEMGPDAASATPFLIELLADANASVRYAATNAIGKLGPAACAAAPALRALLLRGDAVPIHRDVAARALVTLCPADPETRRTLLELLPDDNSVVSRAAAVALSLLGPSRGDIPALIAIARRNPEGVALVLAHYRSLPADATRVLIEALGVPTARKWAVYALACVTPPALEAREALERALDDYAAVIRIAAAVALARIDETARPRMLARIAAALHAPEPLERCQAANALEALGPLAAAAVPALAEALSDADETVRAQAVHALDAIGPAAESAIPALSALNRSRLATLSSRAIQNIGAPPGHFAGLRVLRRYEKSGALEVRVPVFPSDPRFEGNDECVVETVPWDAVREPCERARWTLDAVRHPSIRPVMSSGIEGALAYRVLPPVTGARIEPSGPLEDVVPLLPQIAASVDALHRADVTHRALSLNAFRLADNGLCVLHALPQAVEEEIYGIGKLACRSPEVLRKAPVDHRSDLHAVAGMFYELLTGRHPFLYADNGAVEIVEAIRSGRFLPPSQVRPGLPAGWDAIFTRALAVEPSDRYASALDLFEALAAASPDSAWAQSPQPKTIETAPIPSVRRGATLWVRGSGRERVVRLVDRATLGRAYDANTIVLRSEQVSRRHAEIALEDGRWMLRDIGSSGGTFVDGRRISEHELEGGEWIRMGEVLVGFSCPVRAAQTFALTLRYREEGKVHERTFPIDARDPIRACALARDELRRVSNGEIVGLACEEDRAGALSRLVEGLTAKDALSVAPWSTVHRIAVDGAALVVKIAAGAPPSTSDLQGSYLFATGSFSEWTPHPDEVLLLQAATLRDFGGGWLLPKLVASGKRACDGRAWLALPYIAAPTLREIYQRRETIPTSFFAELARRLEERGLRHGDLKPENILVDRQHGLAVIDPAPCPTEPHHYALYTPAYAPSGPHDATAIALTAIEGIVGKNPFALADPERPARAIGQFLVYALRGPMRPPRTYALIPFLPLPSEIRPGIDPGWDRLLLMVLGLTLVDGALEIDPEPSRGLAHVAAALSALP